MEGWDQRWHGEAGAALAAEIVNRLEKGRSLDGMGLASHDGRVDLRGLPAAPSAPYAEAQVGRLVVQRVRGMVELKRRSLTKLDLSGARLSDWRLRDCTIRDCKFDRAQCGQWVLWNCSISDCSFDRANLRGGGLATFPEGKHNRWERVTFVGADIRDAFAFGGIFVDCNFADARLKELHFIGSQLSRCRFAGRVQEVLFDGRELPGGPRPVEMDAVDFSEAQFVNVDFRGYRLKKVFMPRDENVFLIHSFPCAGQNAINMLAADESVAARQVIGVVANELRLLGTPPDSAFVFNRRDWHEWGGEELLRLAEATLKQAEADCLD